MTECNNEEVRDALPDLLHGRLGEIDRVTMTAHVDTCPDCRAELELLRTLRAAAPLAPGIDAARVVSLLPSGTVASRPAPVMRRTAFKVAAALALVLAGTWAFVAARRGDNVPAVASSVDASGGKQAASPVGIASTPSVRAANPEFEGSERRSVAAQGSADRSDASLSLVSGIKDLSDDQIELLLAGLDEIETIPSAEPQPLGIGMDEIGEEQ